MPGIYEGEFRLLYTLQGNALCSLQSTGAAC
jgi:hypothetical protein